MRETEEARLMGVVGGDIVPAPLSTAVEITDYRRG
jgi:hypothetical protein